MAQEAVAREPGSTIKEFAEKYRLKVTMDEANEAMIKGRMGLSNIYEYGNDVLGVMFMTDGKRAPRTLLWYRFKAACLAAGMKLQQEGDAEGSFTFDPENKQQAQVAIRGIRARVRPQLSEKQLAVLAAGRKPFLPRG